jgi:hypothetical protein
MLHRFGALCAVLITFFPPSTALRAEPAAPPEITTRAKPDDLNPSELLESYRHVQEQLRLTQAAIVSNRLDAEATAQALSAGFAEKLDTIQALMAAEQKRQQALADQAEYERTRQQAEMEQSHQTILWLAAVFGGGGLLAMLLIARLQWRTINRLAENRDFRLQPAASGQRRMVQTETDSLSDQTVALANRRMMSAISRMERRIFELENSAHPLPVARPDPGNSAGKTLA